MKKIISSSIALICLISCAFAQSANPALDLNMVPPTVAINTNSTLQAFAQNPLGQREIVANSLRVLITVGNNAEIIGINPVSTVKWVLEFAGTGTGNSYRLKNIATILPDQVDTILLTIKGVVADGGPKNISGNISYITGSNPLLGGAQNATQGDLDPSPGSNSPITSLTVVSVLAVSLSDVTSKAFDCSAKIAWSTVREDVGSTFDVEYSPDGGSFVKVGTVAGRSATGSNYEYAYSQGNGKGFYRLKIGSVTGGITYSKVVNVITKCNQKKVFIYPNPIQNLQNLQINVSNFVGKVKGDLMNAAGQVVLNKRLVNGLNLIKIANMPEGIYTFKVTDEAKGVLNFKIVVVK